MTLNRVLAVTSVVLGALLVAQVTIQNLQPPPPRLHASWADNANTAEAGVIMSDHVILAEVTGLAKGPDLVTILPEEPEGVDRVPTTIVRLLVNKTYKGDKPPGGVVELLQTGGVTDAVQLPAPPEADQALTDEPSVEPREGPSEPTTTESGSIFLEDDPPYQIGGKYVLFLKNIGPSPGLPTLSPETTRVLASEGRYQVTKGNRLAPATTKKGFAPNWQGRPLSELEAEITKFAKP